jgi:heat shock protein HtpX
VTSATLVKPQVGDPCTKCGWAVVSERGAEPWCPRCGWNIDCYEPQRRRRELRWTWADRFSFEAAYDLNERQFATLSGHPVGKPPFSLAKVSLMLISLVLLACVAGLAGLGVWLIVGIGGLFADVIGLICVFIAFILRPRFGKLGKYAEPLDPGDFPALDRLIGQVASEIGARRPQVLLLDMTFNASSGSYGLRRRRFLSLGLPLWLSLSPQEQVALLTHELGHFVNGDVRRGPMTRFAFQALGTLSAITRPESGQSRYNRGNLGFGRGSSMAIMGDLLARPILAASSALFSFLQLGIEWIGVRASHHAEYAADSMAARVAGSTATASLLDTLMLGDVCMTMLRRGVLHESSPAAWRNAVAAGRVELIPRLERLRQLTMRDSASMGATHPPSGLRARLVESRERESAKIVLTDVEAAAIDADMARVYRTFKTDLGSVTHF